MNIITLEKKKNTTNTIRTIKDLLVSQLLEADQYPYFYSVLQFGFYDNYGKKLPPSEIRKFYDKTEVNRTGKLIYNILKETFGIEAIWMFAERHQDTYDEDGLLLKKGRFHINIITTNIKDSAVEEPNRKCRRLFLENGRFGIPIEQNQYRDIDELKIELFNAACKRANWLNKYSHSIKTQILYEPEDVDAVGHYCLKDFNPLNKVDFTEIILWKSSDFYKP